MVGGFQLKEKHSSEMKVQIVKYRSRIDLLERTFHDWSWDLVKDIWLENFNLLKEYYKEFNKTQISNNETYRNKKLGIWVRNQRIDYIRKEPDYLTKR